MTNDKNTYTENEELKKMLEEQKRENEHQKLVILNLKREKKLREAKDLITNLYKEIIKLKEENKNKGNKRYNDVVNNIKKYDKAKKKIEELRSFLVNVKIFQLIQIIRFKKCMYGRS